MKHSLQTRLTYFLGSKRFFWGLVGLLVLQAAWIAASGRYPMAFDEDFHLGIIRLYAQHGLPFWSHQPAHADMYGAVARDPSYLFHYMMALPYRLISSITSNVTAQVLFLRALNIGLFANGLVLWRRVLLRTGASTTVVHSVLLSFVLIPAVPLLAAQINYDNLIFPLTAGMLLLTLRVSAQLGAHKRLPVGLLSVTIAIGLLTSLVKYAFLPILAGTLLYLAARLWQTYHSVDQLWGAVAAGWQQLTRRSAVGVVALLLLSGGLFAERYGLNVVRYHTPIPDCGQVLTVEQCSHYGPWIRDYNFAKAKAVTNTSPAGYIDDWLYGMWLRLFFAVDGPSTGFETRGPLAVPAIAAIVFAIGGVASLLAYGRQLWRSYNRPAWGLLTVTASIYVSVLWLDTYRRFVATGRPVAINGRYLIPVLLPLLLAAALAFNQALRHRPRLKFVLLGLAIGSLLWGGGALTYILRSDDNWYWQNSALRPINHALQRTLGPVTPGYGRPTLFLR